jgi:hypothetical protein
MKTTRDQLWTEFKKAINHGDFNKFKTKKGMNSFLNKKIKKEFKKNPGKLIKIKFVFMPEPGKYNVFYLEEKINY